MTLLLFRRADHAHPVMIPGHPFKGGLKLSTGYLDHPDMKRFELNDATFFAPPRPDAWAQNIVAGIAGASMPSFGDFFGTYFAGRSFNVTNPKCSQMLEGMKKCYENNDQADPVSQCQYYIQGFERLACGQQ